MRSLLFLSSSFVLLAVAVPNPDEAHSKRTLNSDLSDAEHFPNQHHNPQYDHEAFLGEDQAKTFDQLPPEESRRRLGIIVDRIDKNDDGFVTMDELKNWILYTQGRYIDDDVELHWKRVNLNNNETVTWENYAEHMYGFLTGMDSKDVEGEGEGYSYNQLRNRDRRRFAQADFDGDNALNKTEFKAFLHPEEHPLMKEIIVIETLEDIDKDKDGKVSIQEYIGDMYRADEEGDEPEWVQSERDQFNQFRDANKDGYMDVAEVRAWIMPPDFDHAEAEARHLVFEADKDADEKLTKSEILAKYDLFVGSQATDFGEALGRHDEF